MTSAVADALRATMPTSPPVADEGSITVPLAGGGEVLAGPGTEIPAPPPPPGPVQPMEPTMQPVQFPTSPPLADVQQPAVVPVRQPRVPRPRPERQPRVPVGERVADARDRWAVAPLKFKVPMTLVAVAALGLGAMKWVVPWATPEPAVVLIEQSAPPTSAAAAAASTATTVEVFDPLGWAAWPVNLSARAMIGVQSTGELNPRRAADVSRQAQQKIRDDAVSPCQLRVIVPAPGRLDVTVDATEGAVPLFNCAASSTTTTAVAGS